MKKITLSLKEQKGFTLAELIISVVVGLLIVIIVANIFLLYQRVFRKSNTKAELIQNARITLDLMAREIRQASEIITILPIDDSNPALIAHELQIEDGHTSSQIQYIKYYLDSSDLKRQIIVYYFNTDPSTYVYWDDVDIFGNPEESILEDRLIGENFSSINFYGDDNINIKLILDKQEEIVEIKTIINPRNI